MFKFILLVTLFALAACYDDDAKAEVKSAYNRGDGFGHFEYGIDISNGIEAKAEGDVNSIHGEYFYLNEEGEKVKVTYTADSTGYHPESSILPNIYDAPK